MKKLIIFSGIVLLILSACRIKDHQQEHEPHAIPQVINDGTAILFPDLQSIAFYKTEPVDSSIHNQSNPSKTPKATINIDKNAVVKVGDKSYVFVKRSSTHFERTEITIGNQIRNRIIVLSGLTDGDLIAVEGAAQLKELSFNY